jgi:Rrf2 family protein
MFEIAKGYPSRPTTIKEISERQEVSVAYLEQILNTLRRAGIISSVKGPGGGYLLNRPPKEISIGSILKELEGPVAITSCLDPKEGCSRVDGCVTYLLWSSLGEKIEAFLNTITLDDLLKEEATLKQTRTARSNKIRTGRKTTAVQTKNKGKGALDAAEVR